MSIPVYKSFQFTVTSCLHRVCPKFRFTDTRFLGPKRIGMYLIVKIFNN